MCFQLFQNVGAAISKALLSQLVLARIGDNNACWDDEMNEVHVWECMDVQHWWYVPMRV